MATERVIRPQRRPKSLVLVFTASILIAVGAWEAADLWWRREQTLRRAEDRAGNLAYVLAEYVRGSFAVADASLRQLVVHADRAGGATATRADWTPILSAAQASLPGSGSLSVTNAQGVIIQSSQPLIVGRSRKNDYVFQQLSRTDRDELVVDRPFLSVSVPRRYIIPIGRRLTTADGRFDGIVVATLMPANYREFFRTVDVGRRGITSVFHPDGVVLFREPSTGDPINENASNDPLLHAALSGGSEGVVTGAIRPGGPIYISAYRTGGTPPLVVAVSLDRDEVLAEWQHQRRASALAFAVLTVTLITVVAGLFRQIDARTRAEHELTEVQDLEALRLRDANERLALSLENEQRARRDAETASYLKDEFLMTVSHELRTPLTAIYGWVRMLATASLPPPQQTRALEAIERNARAQTRLVEDLLDVSRAISGKLRIEARAVIAADVLRAAIETLGPALEAKSIELETSISPDVGTIVADPDRLQQIVWNLLSNAIKFTPDGGTVRLAVSRAGSQVEIVVSDTGAGIAPEFLPYVFDRFRQGETGSRRRYGGLGLGLAIVRHLVELHGGTVSVASEGESKGASFRVLLPDRVTSPRGGVDSVQDRGVSAVGSPRLDGVHVLVVDDERDARELFASILEGAGAAVLTAGSVAEAVPMLETQAFDVLLSDIEMPNEDGYTLLQRTLAIPGIASRPPIAIAVTAHTRSSDRRRALDAGFHWHLSKPIEPAALVSAIAALAHPEVRQA